ncbi:biopolymer transporter ExbB [Maritimibacter sp. UBA3975]|uniref:biopolymer transporter ExbB n=1 Tax=Maritimibacter sp. UBA3975 TaxID=1946833 RepID=UPI000C096003|nr:biopolymer transporter ExbB [Maritimibacter sp. UBA3975]MAM63033.1 biopolymer transporter ExbB [Maritimibacter sp.]|tara:strand:+ start:35367 stop:36530 length:1164 start_codon:yes stop_codon:yes gene_type:complete
MDQPDLGAEPKFTRPLRQILTMLIVLGLVGVGVFFALPQVLPVFLANLYLNAFIGLVFVIGLIACFWQVVQIASSVGWLKRFASGEQDGRGAPRLLAPLAALLRSRRDRMQIGSTSARSILDSVATRIDEERDITRYITNLLIFLGLLGTFFGLATTVPAVVETIRSLAPGEGEEGVQVFERLMTGLEAQLGGMGTAFSSSLLGLAGSLVVGLLELFASHGQNRFYRELEEWLSSITKVGFSPGDESQGEAGMAAYLTYVAEQIEALRQAVATAEDGRATTDARLWQLVDGVERLASNMNEQPDLGPEFARMAEGQDRMIAAIEAQGTAAVPAAANDDAEARMRLRSIDVQLLRILEEMAAGRQETMSELRGDINALTKAIRALGGQ